MIFIKMNIFFYLLAKNLISNLVCKVEDRIDVDKDLNHPFVAVKSKESMKMIESLYNIDEMEMVEDNNSPSQNIALINQFF